MQQTIPSQLGSDQSAGHTLPLRSNDEPNKLFFNFFDFYFCRFVQWRKQLNQFQPCWDFISTRRGILHLEAVLSAIQLNLLSFCSSRAYREYYWSISLLSRLPSSTLFMQMALYVWSCIFWPNSYIIMESYWL